MQRVLIGPKSTDVLLPLEKSLCTTESAINKSLARAHSSTLAKDFTGIHSERGLSGSDGGNASNRLLADSNGSSDATWLERAKLSSTSLCSPRGTRSLCARSNRVTGSRLLSRDSG